MFPERLIRQSRKVRARDINQWNEELQCNEREKLYYLCHVWGKMLVFIPRIASVFAESNHRNQLVINTALSLFPIHNKHNNSAKVRACGWHFHLDFTPVFNCPMGEIWFADKFWKLKLDLTDTRNTNQSNEHQLIQARNSTSSDINPVTYLPDFRLQLSMQKGIGSSCPP